MPKRNATTLVFTMGLAPYGKPRYAHAERDLRKWSSCVRAVKGMDYVFHRAAFVGGVGRNASHPTGMFTLNILMNTQMLEAACLEGVERYLYTSRACIYSGKLSFFVEERGGDGPPEKTNASYGWVKRMGELQAQVYL